MTMSHVTVLMVICLIVKGSYILHLGLYPVGSENGQCGSLPEERCIFPLEVCVDTQRRHRRSVDVQSSNSILGPHEPIHSSQHPATRHCIELSSSCAEAASYFLANHSNCKKSVAENFIHTSPFSKNNEKNDSSVKPHQSPGIQKTKEGRVNRIIASTPASIKQTTTTELPPAQRLPPVSTPPRKRPGISGVQRRIHRLSRRKQRPRHRNRHRQSPRPRVPFEKRKNASVQLRFGGLSAESVHPGRHPSAHHNVFWSNDIIPKPVDLQATRNDKNIMLKKHSANKKDLNNESRNEPHQITATINSWKSIDNNSSSSSTESTKTHRDFIQPNVDRRISAPTKQQLPNNNNNNNHGLPPFQSFFDIESPPMSELPSSNMISATVNPFPDKANPRHRRRHRIIGLQEFNPKPVETSTHGFQQQQTKNPQSPTSQNSATAQRPGFEPPSAYNSASNSWSSGAGSKPRPPATQPFQPSQKPPSFNEENRSANQSVHELLLRKSSPNNYYSSKEKPSLNYSLTYSNNNNNNSLKISKSSVDRRNLSRKNHRPDPRPNRIGPEPPRPHRTVVNRPSSHKSPTSTIENERRVAINAPLSPPVSYPGIHPSRVPQPPSTVPPDYYDPYFVGDDQYSSFSLSVATTTIPSVSSTSYDSASDYQSPSEQGEEEEEETPPNPSLLPNYYNSVNNNSKESQTTKEQQQQRRRGRGRLRPWPALSLVRPKHPLSGNKDNNDNKDSNRTFPSNYNTSTSLLAADNADDNQEDINVNDIEFWQISQDGQLESRRKSNNDQTVGLPRPPPQLTSHRNNNNNNNKSNALIPSASWKISRRKTTSGKDQRMTAVVESTSSNPADALIKSHCIVDGIIGSQPCSHFLFDDGLFPLIDMDNCGGKVCTYPDQFCAESHDGMLCVDLDRVCRRALKEYVGNNTDCIIMPVDSHRLQSAPATTNPQQRTALKGTETLHAETDSTTRDECIIDAMLADRHCAASMFAEGLFPVGNMTNCGDRSCNFPTEFCGESFLLKFIGQKCLRISNVCLGSILNHLSTKANCLQFSSNKKTARRPIQTSRPDSSLEPSIVPKLNEGVTGRFEHNFEQVSPIIFPDDEVTTTSSILSDEGRVENGSFDDGDEDRNDGDDPFAEIGNEDYAEESYELVESEAEEESLCYDASSGEDRVMCLGVCRPLKLSFIQWPRLVCVCPQFKRGPFCGTNVGWEDAFENQVWGQGITNSRLQGMGTVKGLKIQGIYDTPSLERCQRLCEKFNQPGTKRVICSSIVWHREGLSGVCEILGVRPSADCRTWLTEAPGYTTMFIDRIFGHQLFCNDRLQLFMRK